MRWLFFLVVMVMGLLSIAEPTFASFVIRLRSGLTFTTDYYWEEGDQVKFTRFGGVVGIPKGLVASISRKEARIDKEAEKQAQAEKPSPGMEPQEAPQAASPPEMEVYRERKQELERRYQEARERLREAVAKGDDLLRREMQKELEGLEQRLSALAREVKTKNHGILPKWWFGHALGRESPPKEPSETDSGPGETAWEKKGRLERELREALERYQRAKELKDPEKIAAEYQEASRLSAELERLKKEVMEQNGGRLPSWWNAGS